MLTTYDKLKNADIETSVQFTFNEIFQSYFKVQVKHTGKCDGLFDDGHGNYFLTEYKYKKDLTNIKSISECLLQALMYIKKIKNISGTYPKVIFIADNKHYTIINTELFLSYLESSDVRWDDAPSSAYLFTSVVDQLSKEGYDIKTISKTTDFNSICEEIEHICKNQADNKPITISNLSNIFQEFNTVIDLDSSDLSYKDRLQLFLSLLIKPKTRFYNISNRSIIYNNKEYNVNPNNLKKFFAKYSTIYNQEECDLIIKNIDVLINNENRRITGSYYTPELFKQEAIRIGDIVFPDWRKHAVWDPACGPAVLTSGFNFDKLFLSTLEQFDIDIINYLNYHPAAEKFQYDFLNNLNEKLLLFGGQNQFNHNLMNVLTSNSPITFYFNPPYKGKNAVGQSGKRLTTNAPRATTTEKMMGASNINCGNLYTQFMYKICSIIEERQLTNVRIIMFTPHTFIHNVSFKPFMDSKWFKLFDYVDGFIFGSYNFKLDTKTSSDNEAWPIFVSYWQSSVPIKSEKNKDEIIHKPIPTQFMASIKEINKNGTDIITYPYKKTLYRPEPYEVLYNREKNIQVLNNCVTMCPSNFDIVTKECIKPKHNNKDEKTDEPLTPISSTFVASIQREINVGGYSKNLSLLSHPYSNNILVDQSNFEEYISYFGARNVCKSNWIENNDHFLVPDSNHQLYSEWLKDALIISIFGGGCKANSYRGIKYEDKSYDIYNQLFWLSCDFIKQLSSNKMHINNDVYTDCNIHGKNERFVYTYLQNHSLTKDGQYILNLATELLVESFELRYSYRDTQLEMNEWDSGIFRLKQLCENHKGQILKKKNLLDKKILDLKYKCKPLMYQLGFLKR